MTVATEAPTVPRHDVRVRRYAPRDADAWTTLLRRSGTGLFIFERPYMDYHADRFSDHSLIVESGTEIVGVFPACEAGARRVVSHGGLTFGGLRLHAGAPQTLAVESARAIRDYYRELEYDEIAVKQVPSMFSAAACDGETYAYWLLGAETTRVDVNFLVDLAAQAPLQERRLRSSRRATRDGVVVAESQDVEAYWAEVLVPVLRDRHGVAPVHSVKEIQLLRERFPRNMRLFVARREGVLLGGTLLYDYGSVLHAQYIGANQAGKKHGVLDLLFHELVAAPPTGARYLSFGIATEARGMLLNVGLADWKEGFGARPVPHEEKLIRTDGSRSLGGIG